MMDLDLYKLNDLKRVQDEILKKEDRVMVFHQIMYSVTAAILTYSISNKNPLIALVPFFIIFPIYNVINKLHKNKIFVEWQLI